MQGLSLRDGLKKKIMEFSVKGPDPPNQHPYWENKEGIAETAKTNGPTCDNMCIQKLRSTS